MHSPGNETTGWQPASRYPDAAIEILDARFERYRLRLSCIERLATGFRWCEGPVWFGDTRTLLWSDIPNNRIMRWDEESGVVGVFRKPSNYANGNTRDRQGRLLTCEHGGRRVTRTEYDGTITVIADGYRGSPLNSPNDIVAHADGSIWFTDPPFGISGHYEGHLAKSELPSNVYRVDPATREILAVIEGITNPNGLAFSPDHSLLYVVECTTPRTIRAYDVVDSNPRVRNGRVLIDAGPGTPDGFRVDIDGNLWCGWGMGTDALDGVRIFSPDGKPIGHLHLPERAANVCFGGEKRNRLLMAASQSVYALYVNTQGVPYF